MIINFSTNFFNIIEHRSINVVDVCIKYVKIGETNRYIGKKKESAYKYVKLFG